MKGAFFAVFGGVLDSCAYAGPIGDNNYASGMLAVQEDARAREASKSLRVRRAAAGALRPKDGGADAHARCAAFAAGDDVALRRGAARARGCVARRGDDAAC